MRSSVIIVAYNSRADLHACLAAVLRDMRAADELIVVDNGSTDGSADLVAAHYPQAQLIRSTNTGYAGGNNRGAAAANGDYLVFLNPDAVPAPGALDALVAPLEAQPATGMTAACVVLMDAPETINACGNTVHYTGLTYCRGANQPRAAFSQAAEVDAVSGAAFAMRRTLFEALGGFDEQFFMYVEDTDLSWRARLAGYRCLYVPGAVVAHRYQFTYSPTKAFYLDRNRHLMLLKNTSRTTYARMLPGLLLGELVTGGFLLLKGPRFWSVKPRVYGWLWRERRAIRTARHAVRAAHPRADQELVARLTHRLAFDQIVHRTLARAASLALHPAFWAARLLFAKGRS